jgi:hypothetical protein
MRVDDAQNAGDQGVAAKVGEIAERDAAAEVFGLVRVATGAAQRTLARDLNGQKRSVARQDVAPGTKNFRRSHESLLTRGDNTGAGRGAKNSVST